MNVGIAFYWGNIPEPTLGGIDRVTIAWASVFMKHGYNVYLIYSGGEKRELPLCFVDSYFWHPSVDKGLESYLKKHNIQICINQRTYDRGIIRVLHTATVNAGCKLYSVFHKTPGSDFYCRRGLIGIRKRVWNILNKKRICDHYKEIVDFSDKVVLLSKFYITLFKKEYNIQETDKLSAIPNPLMFSSETIDRGNKENIILVVSRLEEQQKRISLVLKIFKYLKKKGWRLIIVGDGPDKDKYINYVKKYGIKNVSFVGTTDPKPYYRKAKIFLMTSAYEGWPLTIIEAMQFGVVPVVFDSCLAFHEIFTGKMKDLVIENNNIEKYIEKIEELISSEKILEDYATKALFQINQFKPDFLFKRWFELG